MPAPGCSARRGRPAPVPSPRRCRSATGPGCSRSDQRGRRHNSIRDASAASNPDAGRQLGQQAPAAAGDPAARRWRTTHPTARRSACCPARGGRPGQAATAGPATWWRADASARAAGDSLNRSAWTVGAQYGPSPSSGSGRGVPAAISPAAAADFQDQAQPLLVDAGQLRQPLDFADSEPAAAQFGNRCGTEGFEDQLGFAQQVDDGAGGRCVDVGSFVLSTSLASALTRLIGPGSSPRNT